MADSHEERQSSLQRIMGMPRYIMTMSHQRMSGNRDTPGSGLNDWLGTEELEKFRPWPML